MVVSEEWQAGLMEIKISKQTLSGFPLGVQGAGWRRTLHIRDPRLLFLKSLCFLTPSLIFVFLLPLFWIKNSFVVLQHHIFYRHSLHTSGECVGSEAFVCKRCSLMLILRQTCRATGQRSRTIECSSAPTYAFQAPGPASDVTSKISWAEILHLTCLWRSL